MNVARYAQRVTRYWKQAERHQRTMETTSSNERQQRRQLQRDIDDLKDRMRGLEQAEVKLQKWEGRKAVINHYLSAVQEMSRSACTVLTTLFSMLTSTARS